MVKILQPMVALCALAHASPIFNYLDDNEAEVQADILPAGMAEGVVQWEVESSPGGEVYHLNGTAEQVQDQLYKLSPYYRDDFDPAQPEPMAIEKIENKRLFRRNGPIWKVPGERECWSWTSVFCKVPGIGGRNTAITESLDYVRSLNANVSLEPHTCATISCRRDAAIRWCNDNSTPLKRETFDRIADGARCIQTRCTKQNFQGGVTVVEGRANSYKGGWYVLLTNEQCSAEGTVVFRPTTTNNQPQRRSEKR